MALCGNTLFYVTNSYIPNAYTPFDTLYSVSIDNPETITALFSAVNISISSCAPPFAWNIATTAGICEPFCTPTPKIVMGRRADTTKLDLNGGDAINGREIYTSLGCVGCHQAGQVAPAMAGTYTRIVTERMKDPFLAGMTVEQYLAQSVIEPNTYVVPGFSPIAPQDYGSRISLQELRDLVAYMMTLK
jgi:hypothetical protein